MLPHQFQPTVKSKYSSMQNKNPFGDSTASLNYQSQKPPTAFLKKLPPEVSNNSSKKVQTKTKTKNTAADRENQSIVESAKKKQSNPS